MDICSNQSVAWLHKGLPYNSRFLKYVRYTIKVGEKTEGKDPGFLVKKIPSKPKDFENPQRSKFQNIWLLKRCRYPDGITNELQTGPLFQYLLGHYAPKTRLFIDDHGTFYLGSKYLSKCFSLSYLSKNGVIPRISYELDFDSRGAFRFNGGHHLKIDYRALKDIKGLYLTIATCWVLGKDDIHAGNIVLIDYNDNLSLLIAGTVDHSRCRPVKITNFIEAYNYLMDRACSRFGWRKEYLLNEALAESCDHVAWKVTNPDIEPWLQFGNLYANHYKKVSGCPYKEITMKILKNRACFMRDVASMIRIEIAIRDGDVESFGNNLQKLSEYWYLAHPNNYHKVTTLQREICRKIYGDDENYMAHIYHEWVITNKLHKSRKEAYSSIRTSCLLGQNNRNGELPKYFNLKEAIDLGAPEHTAKAMKKIYDQVVRTRLFSG